MHIRLFVDSLKMMLGGTRHFDAIGNDELNAFVVNTDGAIEYHDFFRMRVDGGTRTPYSVHTDELAEIEKDEVFAYSLNLHQHLPQECQGCRHVGVCAGGFMPGRMSRDRIFPVRKSVLCADQMYFFDAVRKFIDKQTATSGRSTPEN